MRGGSSRTRPFFMRAGPIVFCLALVLSLSRGEPAQSRPNVLVITLDTTRADRMGFLGSTRGLTPALDAFARTATVFTRAYAQAPVTTVSHATLLTGTYPPTHHVGEFGAPLPANVPYLPDLLRRQGYSTAAFVGSLVLDPKNGTAPGFDRGFDVYDAGVGTRGAGEARYRPVGGRGDEVVKRALAGVENLRDENAPRRRPTPAAPFFVWVHLFDPHDPYDPPPDVRAKFVSAPYDGEIAAVDRLAGTLIAAAAPNTLVVVAADHGEALGEHGETTHGVFLYDETLHVPLMIRFPDGRGAGARVQARVRLADVAPTILDALGIAAAQMEGQSLLALPVARDARVNASELDRPVYAESSYPRQAFGWSPLVSWRTDRFLYVRAPKRELYDVVADPAAAKNLIDSRARVADGLDGELSAFLSRTAAAGARAFSTSARERSARATADAPKRQGREGGQASGKPRVDPDLAARLAALGYVSGSSAAPPGPGVDPKDRVAIANALHEAMVAIEDAQFARAAPLLEKVTASEPAIPLAQLNLGVARARQKQYAQAVQPLTRAVALQPDDMRARYELGSALYETGDLKGAAAQFAAVAAKMPAWADARYSLGSVYARIDRVPDAVTELKAALALEPRHFRANLLLGRILTLRGDKASAVTYLRTATEVQPDSAEAKQFLADAVKR